jgi:hypothetical protein
MQLSTHEFFGDAMAIANALLAFMMVYFMQAATRSSGLDSGLAKLQLAQRGLYIALACALFANAMHIYFDNATPGIHEALVEGAWFLLSLASFLRHRMAPPAADADRFTIPLLR